MIKSNQCSQCGSEKNEKITCDACGKELLNDEYIELHQSCHCWGNYSVEGTGNFQFCNLNCLGKADKLNPPGYSCVNALKEENEEGNYSFNIEDLGISQMKEIIRFCKKL